MKVRDLARKSVVTVEPQQTMREAARLMAEKKVGSVLVEDGGEVAGILTERDVLNAVAEGADLDHTATEKFMTRDLVCVPPDWGIYEAAVEMSGKGIRHLVVRARDDEDDDFLGVVSMRDMMMASRRIKLTQGNWAVLRSPMTFTVRERKSLFRQLQKLRDAKPDEGDVEGLVELLVGNWSFEEPVPSDSDSLQSIPDSDAETLRAAAWGELPELQRAVHPAPGWRRRR